jgi:DNA-binding MarR family transcriptional regulator
MSGMTTTEVDGDLAAAVSWLHWEVHTVQSELARQLALTTQQIQLLCSLTHGMPSFGELAGMLGCDKTNVTGLVARLEQRGLVTRVPDKADRRVSRVTLTREGEALGAEFRSAFAEAVALRCESVPAVDRDRLARLANVVAGSLRANRLP